MGRAGSEELPSVGRDQSLPLDMMVVGRLVLVVEIVPYPSLWPVVLDLLDPRR